jgi:hypothetical protein
MTEREKSTNPSGALGPFANVLEASSQETRSDFTSEVHVLRRFFLKSSSRRRSEHFDLERDLRLSIVFPPSRSSLTRYGARKHRQPDVNSAFQNLTHWTNASRAI